MRYAASFRSFLGVLPALLVCACATKAPVPAEPGPAADQGAPASPVARGGALYDTWWRVARVPAPSGDHPLWASRPDKESSKRKGPDTWRCKECHGYDYKGADGVYGKGSRRTGFPGIFGTAKSPDEVVALLKGPHGYANVGLGDGDLRALAQFVKTGVLDTAEVIDQRRRFKGDATRGKATFDKTCVKCHGDKGLEPRPKGVKGEFEAFPGRIAQGNPHEFLHEVRFGKPGSEMPGQFDRLSTAEIVDLAAYAQTLPPAP